MFRECLKQIADRCPGLIGASLVGRDGLPIDSLVVEEGYDLEMISAELVALAQAARENHSEFGGGDMRTLSVETDASVLLLGEAAEDVYLLLFLKRDSGAAHLAQAKFELRRASLVVVPALFGAASPLDTVEVETEPNGETSRAALKHGDRGLESGFSRSLPGPSS